jgi:putative DNA-invertase from lambdoid prophage Rac
VPPPSMYRVTAEKWNGGGVLSTHQTHDGARMAVYAADKACRKLQKYGQQAQHDCRVEVQTPDGWFPADRLGRPVRPPGDESSRALADDEISTPPPLARPQGPCVFGYVRVSTASQAEKGISLEVQKDQIQRYHAYRFEPHGLPFGGFFEDPGQSATVPLGQRQAGARLLTAAGRGDHVVFAKLDRGFRCPIDALSNIRAAQQRGVGLHFLDIQVDTTTEVGEVIVGVLAVVARWENRRRTARVTEAKARLREQGRPTENAPYGMKTVKGADGKKMLVPDPDARKVAQDAVALNDGGLSCAEIANRWNVAGKKTPKGRYWTERRIYAMIQNEKCFAETGMSTHRRWKKQRGQQK